MNKNYLVLIRKMMYTKKKKGRGKKMLLVEWLGCDKHNSWIPESDIQNITCG